MLTFLSAKEPYLVALRVTITLGCSTEYFQCVDFEAAQCLNGTWEITITDTAVIDYIDGREAQIRYVVVSTDDLDHAQEFTFTP